MPMFLQSLGCGLEIYQLMKQLTQNNLCPRVTSMYVGRNGSAPPILSESGEGMPYCSLLSWSPLFLEMI